MRKTICSTYIYTNALLGKTSPEKNIYFWAWSESPKTPPCPQFGQLGPLCFAHMTEFFDDDNDGCNDDYDDNYGKFDDNYEKND